TPGVRRGMRTYVRQDAEGQTLDTHSISAGLDYPGLGPEHSWLKDTGRAEYRSVSDSEAMEGVAALCMAEAGADVIEVGLPYSDPLMDGPVIADAVYRALKGGTKIADVFDTVQAVADARAGALV